MSTEYVYQFEEDYLRLLQDVLTDGFVMPSRGKVNGQPVTCSAKFGVTLRHNLKQGIPLLRSKHVRLSSLKAELLWMLRGKTNTADLVTQGVHIWDAWADANGELGPIYGAQWRAWKDQHGIQVDQVSSVLSELKASPFSRRMLVSAWNVGDLPDMALPPCPFAWQVMVGDGHLHMQVFSRSADIFLGLPFDFAEYAILLEILCRLSGRPPGELIFSISHAHLYSNHEVAARLQLERAATRRYLQWELPVLTWYERPTSLTALRDTDFQVLGYQSEPAIKAEVAV